MKPPFEPLAAASEWLLTLKRAFLLAITSACRAGELAALRVDPPFLQFHLDKVTLYQGLSFLSKVMSYFHLSKPIVLPTFPPRLPHPLNARASLMAFLRGVDLTDICKTATWATSLTFLSHYCLNAWAKAETSVGHAVLASVLS